MKLSVYIHHLTLKDPIHTAHSIITERPTIIIELHDNGQSYWSEVPGFVSGNYHHETHATLSKRWTESASQILDAFSGDTVPNYLAILQNEPIFAYSIDCLHAQLQAQSRGQSLYDFIGCMPRVVDGSAMLGIQATAEDYRAKLTAIKAAGYNGIKLKLDPDHLSLIQSVIDEYLDQFDYICVDANGSFGPDNMDALRQLPESVTIEQPLKPEHHHEFMALIQQLPHQFLVDESVRSVSDLEAFKGLGVGVMLKPVCLGGIQPTITAIKFCNLHLIPCGISGYMDSGIGRYIQWCFTQYPNVLLRSDFVWSDYYFETDIVNILPGQEPLQFLQPKLSSDPILIVGS